MGDYRANKLYKLYTQYIDWKLFGWTYLSAPQKVDWFRFEEAVREHYRQELKDEDTKNDNSEGN